MNDTRAASCCAFCATPASQARYLIVGQDGVCICDACVRRASDILAHTPRPPTPEAAPRRLWWHRWRT